MEKEDLREYDTVKLIHCVAHLELNNKYYTNSKEKKGNTTPGLV